MFRCMGLTVGIESDKEHEEYNPYGDNEQKPFPVHIDIKSIDAIWNPEYENLIQEYQIPIFFKSTLHQQDRKGYFEQGFVDNGRHLVKIQDPEEY